MQNSNDFFGLIRLEDFKVFFDSFVSRKVRKNFKKTELTYDTNYRRQIMYLVERDQKFRRLPNSYKLYTDSIRQIDRDNINALFELVRTCGFPTDDKIGVDRLSDITNPIYSPLMLHQSAGPMQEFDLSSFLTEHILNGNLENKPGFFFLERNIGSDFIQVVNLSYVKVIDTTGSSSNPNNFTIIDSTAYGYYPLDDKTLTNTNKKRMAFYLDDFELNMRKVLFSISNDAFRFDYIGSKSGMIYTNIKDFLEAKKGLKYFE